MSVIVDHQKRKDSDLERALISKRIKGSGVLGKAQFGEGRESMMVEPLDGDPYIYERGGFFTVFRPETDSAWDKLHAKHACQSLFDQLNGAYRLNLSP